MKCKVCKKSIKRVPSQSKRSKSGNLFCSRSCSATFNNKEHPKRQKTKACCKCKKLIRSDSKYCGLCYQKAHYLSGKTLKQATQNRKDNNRYSAIRKLSRKVYLESGRPKCCEVCGYDKHIEICHIRDIASFSKDTLVSEINELANLAALCRNHHWELDKGLLKLDKLK
jgi:hypothetical protein